MELLVHHTRVTNNLHGTLDGLCLSRYELDGTQTDQSDTIRERGGEAHLSVAGGGEVRGGPHERVETFLDSDHGLLCPSVSGGIEHVSGSLVSFHQMHQHRGKVALQVQHALYTVGRQQ